MGSVIAYIASFISTPHTCHFEGEIHGTPVFESDVRCIQCRRSMDLTRGDSCGEEGCHSMICECCYNKCLDAQKQKAAAKPAADASQSS